MSTAIERAIGLVAMSDNAAATVRAHWSQRVNGALETVERMRFASPDDLKRFVVIVPTHFTLSHDASTNVAQRSNAGAGTSVAVPFQRNSGGLENLC